jgi:hypothetical protein
MTTAAFTAFSDTQQFKAHVQPVLLRDIDVNTVILSELHALDHADRNTFMGTCSCAGCNSTAAVFCPGCSETSNLFDSKSRLYVSDGLCRHAAKELTVQLQDVKWNSLTAPAASAAALQQAGGLELQLLQQMNVMVLKTPLTDVPRSPGAAVTTEAAAEAGSGGRGVEAPAGAAVLSSSAAGTAARFASTTSSSSEQQQQQQQQLLLQHLCALSADRSTDMQFLQSWFADFLQEAMHATSAPDSSQVSLLLQPWLQQGQFNVLRAAGQPVCLLCHVPVTSSSTRIALVYTPKQHRRQGHASVAGEASTGSA